MAQFINPPFLEIAHQSGTFIATVTGFAAVVPTPAFRWELVGGSAVIYIPAFNGTSNAVTFKVTNVPAAIQSAHQSNIVVFGLTDAGSDIYLGCGANINGATITFTVNGDALTPFTNTGTKGVPVPIMLSYPL